MAWWSYIRDYLSRSILKHPDEREGDLVLDHVALKHWSVDALYFVLGIFTHIYGAALTILFFLQTSGNFPIIVSILDAFQEPYLGGLGVYVVLKEVRKHYHKNQSRHYGEYFVIAWLFLVVLSTVSILFFSAYRFDEVYKMILTNGLATFIIFLGGIIHRS